MRRIGQSPFLPPDRVQPRYLLLAMALSLLTAVLAISPFKRLLAQVELMVPGGDEQQTRQAHRTLQRSIRWEPRLVSAEIALAAASRGETDFRRSEAADPENGLYAYLRLAPELKSQGRGATASRPAAARELAPEIRDLTAAGPVRFYAGRRRHLGMEAYQSAGFPDRLAARGANSVLTGYGMLYRPVVRRLARGLLDQADTWREGGRAADAVAADAAVVRLMLDLVEDSPWPDNVLLACEYLPDALRGIANGAGSASLPPEVVESSVSAADKVESLREEWHERAMGDSANLIPHTGDLAVARKAQDRLLGSMLASAYAAGTWLGLGLICITILPFAAFSWNSGAVARWRWGARGRLIATSIVTAPMLLAVLVFLAAELPLVWLLSFPSFPGFVLPIFLLPLLVGLAAWVCIQMPPEAAQARLSGRIVLGMAVAAVLVLVGAVILLGVRAEPWRAPAGVQLFRRMGTLAGIGAVVLVLAWMIRGWIRRSRLRVGQGAWASAIVAVAAWAWLATSLVGYLVLQVNAANDTAHEKAFVAAAADPLADRLGKGWRAEHFKNAEDVLSMLDAG